MPDVFEDRRKALEEDYFRRKDKESLDKLRAALHAEAQAKGEEAAEPMQCPRLLRGRRVGLAAVARADDDAPLRRTLSVVGR